MNEKVKRVLARMEAVKHGGDEGCGGRTGRGGSRAGKGQGGRAGKGQGGEFWNVPRTTAEFLGLMVRICAARKVLQIGTSNGYSGLFMAEALSHSKGLLYTVESNRSRFEAAAENFRKSGLEDYIRQVLGHAPEVFVGAESGYAKGNLADGRVSRVELSRERDFDLVFIDATKNEYLSYLEAVLSKVRPGGLIIADNCISHRGELGEFFGFVDGRRDLESVLLPFDNGLLAIFKNE